MKNYRFILKGTFSFQALFQLFSHDSTNTYFTFYCIALYPRYFLLLNFSKDIHFHKVANYKKGLNQGSRQPDRQFHARLLNCEMFGRDRSETKKKEEEERPLSVLFNSLRRNNNYLIFSIYLPGISFMQQRERAGKTSKYTFTTLLRTVFVVSRIEQ